MLDGLPSALAEFIAELILYPIGWPVLKLLTLGKYPVKGSWLAETSQANWTRATGLAVLVIAVMAAAHQFSGY